MTSIRAMIKRLLGETQSEAESADQPSPAFSYRVYWMKTARSWPPDRLDEVREHVQRIVDDPQFEPNPFERRYRVEAVDDEKHAGASLQALLEVIDALKDHENKHMTSQSEEEGTDDK
ncbi:MAG: hypothetical protein R3191_04365 [Anaerolineales bacterium]|nr:hypothetical protein [Anaerolineales bacterium]